MYSVLLDEKKKCISIKFKHFYVLIMLMCFGIEWKRREIYDKKRKLKRRRTIKWVCVDNFFSAALPRGMKFWLCYGWLSVVWLVDSLLDSLGDLNACLNSLVLFLIFWNQINLLTSVGKELNPISFFFINSCGFS